MVELWQSIYWPDVGLAFLAIVLEGAPFLVLGALISGLIDAYVPPGAIASLLPKNRFLAVIAASLLGIVLPLCECAAIPVIRRMLRKGLPLSCGLAYMLAAPVVSPLVWYSTMKAFAFLEPISPTDPPPSPEDFATWRAFFGVLVACIMGWTISFLKPSWVLRPKLIAESMLGTGALGGAVSGTPDAPVGAGDSPDKLAYALRAAMRDFLEVSVFFVIGVGITSILQVQIPREDLNAFGDDPTRAILVSQLVAFVLALCSTSDAFIAANSLSGFRLDASLAFLVFGPMMDVKLVLLYLTIFRRKFVLFLAIGLFVLVALLSHSWWVMLDSWWEYASPENPDAYEQLIN